MKNLENFKAELTEIIETRYDHRKNNCGWGLLYSKLHTLEESQNYIIFLGINPGGEADVNTKNFSYDDMIDKTTGKDNGTWYQEEWENKGGGSMNQEKPHCNNR